MLWLLCLLSGPWIRIRICTPNFVCHAKAKVPIQSYSKLPSGQAHAATATVVLLPYLIAGSLQSYLVCFR